MSTYNTKQSSPKQHTKVSYKSSEFSHSLTHLNPLRLADMAHACNSSFCLHLNSAMKMKMILMLLMLTTTTTTTTTMTTKKMKKLENLKSSKRSKSLQTYFSKSIWLPRSRTKVSPLGVYVHTSFEPRTCRDTGRGSTDGTKARASRSRKEDTEDAREAHLAVCLFLPQSVSQLWPFASVLYCKG